jgi:gluconolactonase
MSTETRSLQRTNPISRRGFIGSMGVVAGAAALAPRSASAQAPPAGPANPASTVTTPPREFGRGAQPSTYVDADVITIDPAFNSLRQGNTPLLRLWTGSLWAEGPAWSGQGRYLVWSDIPNNRQLRWMEDDGRVTASAARRTTPTATPSTSRGASSPASTSRGAWCATSTTAR